jgi:MFS family permease
VFAVQYVTLTGGTLLTTFLLALGADAGIIGLVAALPLLGGLLQPLGAEVVRRRGGRRKPVVLVAGAVDVGLWAAVAAAAVWLPPGAAVVAVVGVLALQQAATAFIGVAWTSWISDLVPPPLRGRFFGRRNVVCNALGAATALGAGAAVRAAGGDPIPTFLALIGLGVAFRFVSLAFLARQPEPRPAASAPGGLLAQLRGPLAHPVFRQLLAYQGAWSFGVNLASPFFTVYMLEEAGVGAGTALAFAALGTLSNLVGQRVWGPLCDRYGDHQVLRVTAFAAAVQPMWWLLTGPGSAGVALMAVLSATGGFAWAGVALAAGNLTMRLAPEVGKTSFFGAQAAVAGAAGAAGALVGGALAAGVFAGFLKGLFVASAVLRVGAWLLQRRIPTPSVAPRLRTVVVLRDTVRTLNPAQGFSPVLHAVAETTGRARRTLRRRARTVRAQAARRTRRLR